MMIVKINQKRQKAQVSIIVAVGISILLGMVSLVADYGIASVTKNRMQYALDAAVLAGAQDLMMSGALAQTSAQTYLQLNGVTLQDATIIVDVANKKIAGQATRRIDTFFARFIGVDSVVLNASSEAIIGAAKSVSGGLRPYAVEDRYFEFGEVMTLKSDKSYHGNYGTVALGGNGANVLRDNALNGYSGTIKIGDQIDTEPGNMAGVVNAIKARLSQDPSTWENYTKNSFRVWTIPVVDSLEVSGRKYVTVTGFASVFVQDVVSKSGKMEITGRFIRFVGSGELDASADDFGVYAVKLVH